MINMIREFFYRHRLRSMYAITVALMLAIVFGLMFVFRYIFVARGIIPKDAQLTTYLAALAVISIIMITAVSALLSKFTVMPIRKIIRATDRLAEGDFTARINLRMGGEMADFNNRFNAMAEQLEKSTIMKTDFVSNFAHEFKTPMVSIRGFAKMLADDNLTDDERKEYIDIIVTESNRLIDLSSNILSITRIENMQTIPSLTRFNLSEQIRRIIVLMAPKWDEKNLGMDFESDEIFVYASEDLLKEVWINLIDNSIKFSPEGGNILMTLGESPAGIVFTIFNQGPPIEKDAVDRLFDKFYQGDISHAQKGSGLGLSLASQIVTLHKGSIRVLYSGEQGTCFEVILPEVHDNEK